MLGTSASPMAAKARGTAGMQKSRGQEIKQLRSKLKDITGAGEQKDFQVGENSSDGEGSGRSREELMEVANKVEGLLVNQLVKQMRKTVPDNELTGGGYGGEVFRTHLDRKYSELIAKNSDFKMAEQIYSQFNAGPTSAR